MTFLARFLPGLVPGLGAFLNPWVLLVLGVLLASAGGLGKLWLHERSEFASYQGAVEALNVTAQDRTRARIALDKSRKETADAQNSAATLAWLAAVDRLRRDAGPVGPIVPAAAPGAAKPERACFDRAILEPGLRGLLEEFRGETRGIVAKGDGFRLKLDNAIGWGASIQQ